MSWTAAVVNEWQEYTSERAYVNQIGHNDCRAYSSQLWAGFWTAD